MKGSKKGFYDSLKVGLSEEEQAKKAEEIKKKIASHKYRGGFYELDEEEKEEYNLTDYLYMILNEVASVPLGIKKEDFRNFNIFDVDKFNNIKISKEDYENFYGRWEKYTGSKYNELMRQEED